MTSTPPWAFIVTALVAVIGWFAVNQITNRRELRNWRRTTLLTAVSAVLEASTARYDLVHQSLNKHVSDRPAPELLRELRKIQTALHQIRLCNADRVWDYAYQIERIHTRSTTALDDLEQGITYDTNNDPINHLSEEEWTKNKSAAYIDWKRLDWNHGELVKELQVEIKLRKAEFNPDHAQVVHLQRQPKIQNK